jgi:protein-tyrosine-phosphatase
MSIRSTNMLICVFALGSFCFYVPYSALTKSLSIGVLPGASGEVSGFELLPPVCMATAITVPLLITALGWWKYAGRRRVLGKMIPFPSLWPGLSGLATAIIIATTTLAYTFTGISIVFALLLMRGGVLVIAPIVDWMCRRQVRWYSWTALSLSLTAVAIALFDSENHLLTGAVVANLAAYLLAYIVRLNLMTRVAKTENRNSTYRYFVEEQLVSMPVLVLAPGVLALIAPGDAAQGLFRGFTTILSSDYAGAAYLIGTLYGCLFLFGSLIYLDARENSYCVPVNRCSSLVAGLVATYGLAVWLDQPSASTSQLIGTSIIVVAIVVLGVPLRRANRDGRQDTMVQRMFLFVCSRNTVRSPMAALLCNAEIATRLGIVPVTLNGQRVFAASAGLDARPGAPMTRYARSALSRLGVAEPAHEARCVDEDLINRAEVIFCMSGSQVAALLARFPSALPKVECLDDNGDVEDPADQGPEAFLACAQQLMSLVEWRLTERRVVPA